MKSNPKVRHGKYTNKISQRPQCWNIKSYRNYVKRVRIIKHYIKYETWENNIVILSNKIL